jgi:hypothetical protein
MARALRGLAPMLENWRGMPWAGLEQDRQILRRVVVGPISSHSGLRFGEAFSLQCPRTASRSGSADTPGEDAHRKEPAPIDRSNYRASCSHPPVPGGKFNRQREFPYVCAYATPGSNSATISTVFFMPPSLTPPWQKTRPAPARRASHRRGLEGPPPSVPWHCPQRRFPCLWWRVSCRMGGSRGTTPDTPPAGRQTPRLASWS